MPLSKDTKDSITFFAGLLGVSSVGALVGFGVLRDLGVIALMLSFYGGMMGLNFALNLDRLHREAERSRSRGKRK